MNLRKALLVKLPNGRLVIHPIEEIKYGHINFPNRDESCKKLTKKSKLSFWVYEKELGYDLLGNANPQVHTINKKDVDEILNQNEGFCYVQTESDGSFASPKNALGERAIIIHLGFNKWIDECEKLWKNIPRPREWFVDFFYKGYTPVQTINEHWLVEAENK